MTKPDTLWPFGHAGLVYLERPARQLGLIQDLLSFGLAGKTESSWVRAGGGCSEVCFVYSVAPLPPPPHPPPTASPSSLFFVSPLYTLFCCLFCLSVSLSLSVKIQMYLTVSLSLYPSVYLSFSRISLALSLTRTHTHTHTTPHHTSPHTHTIYIDT